MKPHPNQKRLVELAAEGEGLTRQIAAVRPDDANAMREMLARLMTQHMALLVVMHDVVADQYPLGVAQQPDDGK